MGAICHFSKMGLLILLFSFSTDLFSESYRFVSYNLLNFSGRVPSDIDRVPSYQKILEEIDPDILTVQEVEDKEALTVFLRDVFTYSQTKQFRAAPFNDGPDTDNALFYNKNRFQFISQEHFGTNYRNISHFVLVPTDVSSPDTLHVYSAHLKAGTDWQAERNREAKILRSKLNRHNAHDAFIVCGDMNFYTSKEAGFQTLIRSGSDTSGQCFDPIGINGDWHNDSKYALIHTQSTRVNGNNLFSGGGLDDRFDLVLLSRAFFNESGYFFNRGSYKAFGNDGLHFNKAINSGDNRFIHPDVADALYEASDHLPVFMDFDLSSNNSSIDIESEHPVGFQILSNYPNPFNAGTVFSFNMPDAGNCHLSIFDENGRLQSILFDGYKAEGQHRLYWNGRNSRNQALGSGLYIAILRQNSRVYSRKIMLLK